MPIHDFRCTACGITFELLVRGAAPAACPGCKSTQVQKALSAPAPPGKSAGIIAGARARAARAGHLSNE